MRRTPSSKPLPTGKTASQGGALCEKARPDKPIAPRLPGVLALVAFLLLTVAVGVRPMLGESWTVRPTELVSPSPLWWNSSPGAMYVAHILAGAGILTGLLWLRVTRKSWRFTGLELAAGLLTIAALLSVPYASDKRLAINVAIGTILPLLAAGVLYQLLATGALWRRALLAVLVAGSVANCYASWRQRASEFDATYKQYMADKERFWASQGKTPTDPEVAIYEARLLSRQPTGYFYHPNVMASFVTLGLFGTIAAAAGFPWRRRGRESDPPPAGLARAGLVVGGIALVGLVLWQLLVIRWVGSAGAIVGLVLGTATGAVVWRLRQRPVRSAIACGAVLLAVQATLVVLGFWAQDLYPKWAANDGKLKSLAVRLNYWEGAATLLMHHPITGVGPGQFGMRYVAVKPIRAAEEVAHPHNWLLNIGAEWGILGVLGIITALALPGWRILRRLADPPDVVEPDKTTSHALLLAAAAVYACFLVTLPGILSAGSYMCLYMAEPIAWAILSAVVVSASASAGRLGAVVLLAGLVAFFLHGTVEMNSAVAGAAWPFWAFLVLTLAWGGTRVSSPPDAVSVASRWARAAWLVGVTAAVLVMLGLTLAPLRAVCAMSRARDVLAEGHPREALAELTRAAGIDALDPAPLAAQTMIHQQAAAADRQSLATHLRDAAASAQAAVERDPGDNVLWNDLAVVRARLAAVTRDPDQSASAVAAMQRAVDLYPNWPRGRWRLAEILVDAAGLSQSPVDLLRAAVEQYDLSLQLDARWPGEDARRFDDVEIERIKSRLAATKERLASPSPTVTNPGQ